MIDILGDMKELCTVGTLGTELSSDAAVNGRDCTGVAVPYQCPAGAWEGGDSCGRPQRCSCPGYQGEAHSGVARGEWLPGDCVLSRNYGSLPRLEVSLPRLEASRRRAWT